MGPVNAFTLSFLRSHVIHEFEKTGFEFLREVNGESFVGIVQNSVRGPVPESAFDQNTIRRKLKDMRVKRTSGNTARLHLYRDQLAALPDKIIRSAGQLVKGIIEWFFSLSPKLRIRSDHPAWWESSQVSLPG
jgi:hypothetical protein